MCAHLLRTNRPFPWIKGDIGYFSLGILIFCATLGLAPRPSIEAPLHGDPPGFIGPWLGHRGAAYYGLGVSLLAKAVQVFHPHPREGAFQALALSTPRLAILARGHLGFTEPFLYTSQAFLFLKEDPPMALGAVGAGLLDPHTDSRLPLLGGFTELFLMGRPWPAGLQYGRIVLQEPGAPQWLAQFSLELLLGVAPIQRDLGLRTRMCRSMAKTFAQARVYFKRAGSLCQNL